MAIGEAGQVAQKRKTPILPVIILIVSLIFIIWLMALNLSPEIYEDYGMDLSKENWLFLVTAVMIGLIIVLMIVSYPSRTEAPQFTSQAQPAAVSQAQTAPIPQVASTSIPLAPSASIPEVTVTQAPIAVEQPAAVMAQPAAAVAQPVEIQEMAVVEAEPIVVEAEIVEAEAIEVEVEEVEAEKPLKMKKPRVIEYPKKVPGGVYGDTIVRTDPYTKLNLRTLLVRSCIICDRQDKCWEGVKDTISRDDFLGNIDCKKGLRNLKGPRGAKRPLKKKKKKMAMKVKQTITEESSD